MSGDIAAGFCWAHDPSTRQPTLLNLDGTREWPGRWYGLEYRRVLIRDREGHWFCGYEVPDLGYQPPPGELFAFCRLTVPEALVLCRREGILEPSELVEAYEASRRPTDAQGEPGEPSGLSGLQPPDKSRITASPGQPESAEEATRRTKRGGSHHRLSPETGFGKLGDLRSLNPRFL
jgi:hypothetical protein